MLLFLDLEETLVDNWDNGFALPANMQAVYRMFGSPTPTVGLMSWAVWDAKDKHRFNTEMRPDLETMLGLKFDDNFVWSMDDWCTQLLTHRRKKVSREDLFDCFGKEEVLFMLSRCHPAFLSHGVATLVDDAVEHGLSWTTNQNECRVRVVNIKELLKC